jgi:DNA-binding HxlR family transcriptional regulator
MTTSAKSLKKSTCPHKLIASRDALDAIQGKWRVPIIITLSFGDKKFGEIRKDITDISPKMLSQELKELERNHLISRKIYDTMPVTVEYALTPLGCSLEKLLEELTDWGVHFRKTVIGKK